MSAITCPRCGSDNTSSFFDSVLKTQGYHCEDCKMDFGVDDGKSWKQHEELLTSFTFRHTIPQGQTVKIVMEKGLDNKVSLTPTIVQNGLVSTAEPITDFGDMFPEFTKLIFEKLYILDWPDKLEGVVTDKDPESYFIGMTFKDDLLPSITKEGMAKVPPYLIVLDKLFGTLFDNFRFSDEIKK
ncbi:MAG: hypothetical protein LKM30_03005 [Bacilli bacterium]|jgi:hypothetical protein|nr:hypothetical protein [Bacilli bacterium]